MINRKGSVLRITKVLLCFLLILGISLPANATDGAVNNKENIEFSLAGNRGLRNASYISTNNQAAYLEEQIGPQIRKYAKSINQSNADDTAAMALAKHGITNRKTLKVNASHALTATLMNSELALERLIRGCAMGIDAIAENESGNHFCTWWHQLAFW